MFTVAVKRDFVAQHHLIGGDWGDENIRHSHHYYVELQLSGAKLGEHDYMVDIVEVEALLDEQVHYYKDTTLNDLPEFKGHNPSIERFALILCMTLSDKLHAPNVGSITVKLWENEIAWASYTSQRHGER
ncbi:MAG: 6-pyruvoyl trahydropterin synthase family protein [Halobacteriota archaeon]